MKWKLRLYIGTHTRTNTHKGIPIEMDDARNYFNVNVATKNEIFFILVMLFSDERV